MWESPNFELKDEVDFTETEELDTYILPKTQEYVSSAIGDLGTAFESLRHIAGTTDQERIRSAFVSANRSFGRVFKTAYEYEATELNSYKMPTVGDIQHEIAWMREQTDIPPRTISIEKTSDSLLLTYEHGFNATEEKVTVPTELTDSIVKDGIGACGEI